MHVPYAAPSLSLRCQCIRPIRVGFVLSAVGAHGGGVSISAEALARALDARPGVSVEVFACDAHASDAEVMAWRPVRLTLHPVRGYAGFGYAPGLVEALVRADLDLVHLHGIWTYVSVAVRRWRARTSRPYVVSPHGMLDPWAVANSGWKKAIALALYEKSNLTGAAVLHALCDAEREAIIAAQLGRPIEIVPNGVDLPPPAPSRVKVRRTLLFLGRLTEKKGLASLLEAWSATRDRENAADWNLVIAGAGQPKYVAGLERLVAQLGITGSVRFVGHRAGADKAAAFRAADAFILPSVSEGQPMAVLEAWSYGVPTLITPECNLPEGVKSGAALTIGHHADAIADGLALLFATPDRELATMAASARRLAERSFSWASAASQWEARYRDIALART